MVEPTTRVPYHHGDLRGALIEGAAELLAEGASDISLREVARRAGVSPTAPYRHFVDKEALLLAVALSGFDSLAARASRDDPSDAQSLSARYVDFAAENKALFRLMFLSPRQTPQPELVFAVQAIAERFTSVPIGGLSDPHSALGQWALPHGVACLCRRRLRTDR